MPPQPFPSITGSCACGTVTFQLLKPPLFVFACHCTTCQKATGSAFAVQANIERTAVSVTSTTQPVPLALPFRRCTACPNCAAILWANEVFGAPVCDVRVGVLDKPALLEPDWHSYVKTKFSWVRLPDDARTSVGHFDIKTAWPQDSLRRLVACLDAWNTGPEATEGDGEDEDGSEGEGERTPTGDEGVSGDEEESDEAFEERVRETERRLTERLEMLNLKLDDSVHGEAGEAAKTGEAAKAGEAIKTGETAKTGETVKGAETT